MSGQRIRYYDLLRVLCTAFIIYYHMMVELVIEDIYPSEDIFPLFSTPNISFATLGVAVFFMLSGAGLTLSNSKEFKLRGFYLKRFLTVLVPVYITNIFFYIVKYAFYGENWLKVLMNWQTVYTLLGVDEYMRQNGAQLITSGIGEWFLGVLVIIYILYPVFRYLMNRFPYLFFAVATSIYVAYIFNYTEEMPPVYMTLPAKAYEFIVGMYLAKFYIQFPKKMMLISIPVCTFFAANKWPLGLNNSLMITACAFFFVVSVSYLEPYLNKCKCKVLSFLSGISYYVFLTHHVVIYIFTPIMKPYISNKFSVLLLFAIELVVTFASAMIIKALTGLIVKGVGKLKQGKKKELPAI